MSDGLQEKGEILGVGTFDENGYPVGWVIRGNAALTITENGVLFGGYTAQELREIAEAEAS